MLPWDPLPVLRQAPLSTEIPEFTEVGLTPVFRAEMRGEVLRGQPRHNPRSGRIKPSLATPRLP